MTEHSQKLSHYFTHSKRKGRAGLPLMSVTMRDGLVRRDALDRKTDSALKDEEHLLIEPGDIAYNMMRMWQGALGLSDQPANVSPAYGVMRPKDTVDPRFAKHWFKSDRGLYMLWAYSYGLTEDRLRLYPAEFLKIPVSWPSRSQQKQIADILDAWDSAISELIRSVSLCRKRLSAARKKLIAGDLIRLTKLATISFSGVDKKIDKTERPVQLCNYTHIWRHDNLVSELSYDAGTAVEKEVKRFSLKQGDFIFTKDSETAEEIAEVAYVAETMPDVVCGYHLALARPKPGYNGAYVAQAMRLPSIRHEFAKRANGAIRFGLTLDTLSQIQIPVPDEAQQVRIANYLQSLEAEIALKQSEVHALRQQKQAIRRKLLSTDDLIETPE